MWRWSGDSRHKKNLKTLKTWKNEGYINIYRESLRGGGGETFPIDFLNFYTFYTKRQFGTCLKDSQKAILLCKNENQALPEHACQTNHTIAGDNSEIITTNSQHLGLKDWHFNFTHVHLNRDYGGLYLTPI